MKTLLLDNYDSFTYNLFHLIALVRGDEPLVLSNDQAALEEIRALPIDSVVISPGPGRPERARDFGVCAQVLRCLDLPQLGICLGHQGLAHCHGGRIVPAPFPAHGELCAIRHDYSPLFRGIPQGFAAVRYHSLMVAPDLPDCLAPTAWTCGGLLMGLCHRRRPLWGVQFHPESVCTEYGDRLLRNFLDQVPAPARILVPGLPAPSAPPARAAAPALHWRRVVPSPDPERVFAALFGAAGFSFWLDSSLEQGAVRFSYMGAAQRAVKYWTQGQRLCVQEPDGSQVCHRRPLLDFLREHRRPGPPSDLPFPFAGGWVGYLGYEFKSDCLAIPSPPSPHPDAALLEVDRLLVFDHCERALFLVVQDRPAAAARWFAQVEAGLAELPPLSPVRPATPGAAFPFRPRRSRPEYLADIGQCLKAICQGESYELCLTNQLAGPPVRDPLACYRVLRRLNPAPYAAFLRLDGLALLSSSPELFLRVDAEGLVHTKPIKGTRGRGDTPEADQALRLELASSAKDRAENLMITDLLRHDLGRVCRAGTVQVPSLMAVETFSSCHQLVSTVCGRLRPGQDALDCLRAAFPGGSMTGAPKLRSLEILDQIEASPRGPYSGALGFLSFDGQLELSIVIRTAVCDPGGTTVGAGGAIVARSDPAAEYAELLLKARPVLKALSLGQTGNRVASLDQIA